MPPTEPKPVFVNMRYVAKVTGLDVRQQLTLEYTGAFPRSTSVSPRLRIYRKADIDDWVDQQLARIESGAQDAA